MIGDVPVILSRAHAINLPINELCRRARVDRSTVTKLKKAQSSPNMSTVVRLSNAVLEEERRLLAHLRKIHGDAA